jgi:hypothetical protein
MHTVSIITAPSDLGLRPTGVARLPQALREAGVLRGVDDVASGMQRFRQAGRSSPVEVSMRVVAVGQTDVTSIAKTVIMRCLASGRAQHAARNSTP